MPDIYFKILFAESAGEKQFPTEDREIIREALKNLSYLPSITAHPRATPMGSSPPSDYYLLREFPFDITFDYRKDKKEIEVIYINRQKGSN